MKKLNDLSDLKTGDVAIVIVSSDYYDDFLLKLFKDYSKKGEQLTFISATRRNSDFNNILKAKNIKTKNLCFIDTLTKLNGEMLKNKASVMYAEHPSDLTEILINVTACIERYKNNVIVLDSLSSFFLYNNPIDLIKFIHMLSQKTKKLNSICILVGIKEEIDSNFIKKLGSYCDYQIDLTMGEHNYFISP